MQKVLILQYNGIGDCIINAELIKSLIDSDSISDIYLSSNDMWEFLKPLIDTNNKLNLLPPNYRSLEYITNIQEFVIQNNITDIISFRKDILKNPLFFEHYKHTIPKSTNFYCYEKNLSIDEYTKKHFYVSGRNLIKSISEINPPNQYQGWLLKYFTYIKQEKKNQLILYLGASVKNKRLPISTWCSIINNLFKNKIDFIILQAYTQEEKNYENAILSHFHKKIQFLKVQPQNFSDIIKYLLQSKGLISCDTYIVHLAVSLNIPVFGIYVSSDSKIYGPIGRNNEVYQNPRYKSCSNKNLWGNCNGWNSCNKEKCFNQKSEKALINKINNWIINQ